MKGAQAQHEGSNTVQICSSAQKERKRCQDFDTEKRKKKKIVQNGVAVWLSVAWEQTINHNSNTNNRRAAELPWRKAEFMLDRWLTQRIYLQVHQDYNSFTALTARGGVQDWTGIPSAPGLCSAHQSISRGLERMDTI